MKDNNMYITKITSKSIGIDTLRLIENTQEMHTVIATACPYDSDCAQSRTLWRCDGTSEGPVIYVLSPSIPNMALLESAFGGHVISKEYELPAKAFERGARITFRVSLNPTRNIRNSDNKTQRVVIPRQERQKWLESQAVNNGFTIVHASSEKDLSMTVSRSNKKGGDLKLIKETYSGVLEVSDPDKFRTALFSGIGRGRAFGCGFLTLGRFVA